MVVDERYNQLDELVSQPLLVGQCSGSEERVLDPSPSPQISDDSVLEASGGGFGFLPFILSPFGVCFVFAALVRVVLLVRPRIVQPHWVGRKIQRS